MRGFNSILIFLTIIVLALIALRLSHNTKTITIGGKTLTVEVANTPWEREQGLSGRDGLSENMGMLFIFPEPTIPQFWMKDMKFALDIIWLDADWRVVGIEHGVTPDTYPQTFAPSRPIRYVVEVPAGWADRLITNL